MPELVDNYRHKGLRKKLLDVLRSKGIKDEKVLKAIDSVPRHFFLDESFMEKAYEDKPFQIGYGQTISQPYTVARQSELLELTKGQKVLEIGTGSGYQAAILSKLEARVYTIERQKPLYDRTSVFLKEIGLHRIKTFFGDGFKGLPSYAPFDRIIITAAAPEVPQTLLEQLDIDGYLVIPLGEGKVQRMLRIRRTPEGFKTEELEKFSFVPMLKGKAF